MPAPRAHATRPIVARRDHPLVRRPDGVIGIAAVSRRGAYKLVAACACRGQEQPPRGAARGDGAGRALRQMTTAPERNSPEPARGSMRPEVGLPVRKALGPGLDDLLLYHACRETTAAREILGATQDVDHDHAASPVRSASSDLGGPSGVCPALPVGVKTGTPPCEASRPHRLTGDRHLRCVMRDRPASKPQVPRRQPTNTGQPPIISRVIAQGAAPAGVPAASLCCRARAGGRSGSRPIVRRPRRC
jgi:hypothetical protein